MCVVRARGAHLSRHKPAVEKCKCLCVYPKNVHQPWPLALKLGVRICSRLPRGCSGRASYAWLSFVNCQLTKLCNANPNGREAIPFAGVR